jgi:hypothetical protein
VDPSRWLTELREQGYEVSPLVETILRSFGGLRFQQRRYGGHSADTFDVEPRHWYGHANEVTNLEALLGQRICPIGEASGAATLAVMADGRVIPEFEGCVDVLGRDWREARITSSSERARPSAPGLRSCRHPLRPWCREAHLKGVVRRPPRTPSRTASGWPQERAEGR